MDSCFRRNDKYRESAALSGQSSIADIDGVDFDEARSDRCVIEMDGLTIPFIGKGDLIRNKRATGRPKDRLDADDLAAL